MWEAGIQLHTVCVEDEKSHSKCVAGDDADVHDKQTTLKTRGGQEDNKEIEGDKKNEIRPDDITLNGHEFLQKGQHKCNHVD